MASGTRSSTKATRGTQEPSKVTKPSSSKPKTGGNNNGGSNGSRQTETHIFFGGGPLSNWNRGVPYSGARALSLLIERLDAEYIDHPPEIAASSRLLIRHKFVCGEQFMMAIKGWLFEREFELLNSTATGEGFDAFAKEMRAQTPPPKDQKHGVRAWKSTLCSVLRTPSPAVQKKLGRVCMGFEPATWDLASIHTVVACSVARAEADPALKQIYMNSGDRVFVEGSFRDLIWGVGIHWSSSSIEDEKNWRGTNRLGKCHAEARDVIRGSVVAQAGAV